MKRDRTYIYQAINEVWSSNQNYSILLLCELSEVSRSGYYKWLKRKDYSTPRQLDNERLKELILECYEKVKGIYGY